ncbi:MAG: DsbA family protein [Pseudomonadota bacterium]|nr:DsbA family protein [Pseudomonadota bacterium]
MQTRHTANRARRAVTPSLVIQTITVFAVIALGYQQFNLGRRVDAANGDALVDSIVEAPRMERVLREQIDQYVERRVQDRKAERNAPERFTSRTVDVDSIGVQPHEPVYGSPDAPITMIVYSDYECPYCKQFYGTPQQVADESEGEINVVYRHLPLKMHGQAARLETVAAECVAARGGDYWGFSREIYQLTRGNGAGLEAPIATVMARAGIGKAQLQACIGDASIVERIQRHLESAQRLGVTATPTTLVVDNRTGAYRTVGGKSTAEHLRRIVARFGSAS